MGKEISTFLDYNQVLGEHQVTFNAEGLPAGIYFVRISLSNSFIVKKIIKW